MNANFNILLGETIASITGLEAGSDEVRFTLDSGATFELCHIQDCCEKVEIVDVAGDVEDLINSPILLAEEATSEDMPEGYTPEYQPESFTWTFYKLATIKGYVTIRWLGKAMGIILSQWILSLFNSPTP